MSEHVVAPRTAWAGIVVRGSAVRIRGRGATHLVAFGTPDIRERFDDARTRGNPGKLFITAGDFLISKANNKMMKILEDGYAGIRHDLATGMCLHCRAVLARTLQPWNIPAEDIPASFNIFKRVEIDGISGRLSENTELLAERSSLKVEAQMDCLVAIVACAEPATITT